MNVDDQRQFESPGLLASSVDRGGGLLDRMVLVHDVPDLDGGRAAIGQVAHAGAGRGLVGEHHEHALRRQVQPVVDGGEERPRRRDVRHLGVRLGPRRQPQRPGIAADVEDRRHSRAEVRAAVALRVQREAGDDLFIRMLGAHVDGVGAAVGPAGLGEVNVRIHQAGRDPEALEIADVHPGRHRAGGARAGALDLAFTQHHDGVGHRRGARAVHQRRSHQRPGRRRHSRLGGEGGGDGDLPALRRLDEQPLGDPRILPAAVAHAVAVGAVDQPGTHDRQVDVVRVDMVGPALADAGSEALVAELRALEAGAGQALGIEIAGEVGRLVPCTNGL